MTLRSLRPHLFPCRYGHIIINKHLRESLLWARLSAAGHCVDLVELSLKLKIALWLPGQKSKEATEEGEEKSAATGQGRLPRGGDTGAES